MNAAVTLHHLYWLDEDKGYPVYQYEAYETPETLLRMGLAYRAETKAGIKPSGHLRCDGTMRVYTPARKVIRRDERFRLAMQRVLDGAELPAFELPRAKRKRVRQQGDNDGAEAQS